MRRAVDRGHDLLGEEEPQDDLVLGAPALLGIFFAVAVICAVCFGFGYSSGHGAQTAARTAETPAAAARADAADGASKPLSTLPPGSEIKPLPPLQEPQAEQAEAKPVPGVGASTSAGDRTDQAWPPDSQEGAAEAAAARKGKPSAEGADPAPSQPVRRAGTAPLAPAGGTSVAGGSFAGGSFAGGSATDTVTASPALRRATPAATPAIPTTADANAGEQAAAAPSLNLMVQIAAVSHAADAQTLAAALRHDGFAAIVRSTTGDPLFHVQVGPFATLQAAKAMRTRLADTGYNAFIKP